MSNPNQPRMFETQDLPLFSSTAPRATDSVFVEQEPEPRQLSLPDAITRMNDARLDRCLDTSYSYHNEGIMTLRRYLATHTFTDKTTWISNHTEHRVCLEYKKTKDKYSYTLNKPDGMLITVPKLVYDTYDIPERIVDNRFD